MIGFETYDFHFMIVYYEAKIPNGFYFIFDVYEI